MGLATAIRFELAYPGLGIFAGDSLQYLSVVTAHGVIMVFFMIMPLLFGAFGNFLLPTQLGVHDVAFPRLNSAAFWFLPAGFLMLGQLLCIDRRYQRMNCFNIREAQSLLKREFFTDLVNSNDHRDLLTSTMINYRYKTGSNSTFEPNFINFINFGTSLLSLQSESNVSNTTTLYFKDQSALFSNEMNSTDFTNPYYLDWVIIIKLIADFNSILSAFITNLIFLKTFLLNNTFSFIFTDFTQNLNVNAFFSYPFNNLYVKLYLIKKPFTFLIDKNFYYSFNENTLFYYSYLYSFILSPNENNPYYFKSVNYVNENINDALKSYGSESTSEIRVTQLFEPL